MEKENFIFVKNKQYELYQGEMQNVLITFEENSIDSIVTDPPYELNFMGKGWDNTKIAFQKETWQKCFNVLKPGGYLLAFGGSRTFHRIACAIEDAGFEIRDCIMWLYGSGFPKSMALDKSIEGKLTIGSANTKDFKKLNGELVEKTGIGFAKNQFEQGIRPTNYNENGQKRLGKLQPTTDLAKQYQGWGTCLKPAFEPIIVARKPFKGSLVDNVLEHGVGGLNIDECRVPFEDTPNPATNPLYRKQANYKLPEKGQKSNGTVNFTSSKNEVNKQGRFPANVILTYDETDFEEVCGGFPISNKPNGSINKKYECNNEIYGDMPPRNEFDSYQDIGSSSRYFYCAKASKKDRDEGLDNFEEKQTTDGCIRTNSETARKFGANSALRKNIHPTVKPVELMQYLVRLVTPKGGTVLDCFMGSGSTGKAVMFENRERNANYKFIGVEMTKEYLPICQTRIDYALNKYEYDFKKELEEHKEKGQQSIFDFIDF